MSIRATSLFINGLILILFGSLLTACTTPHQNLTNKWRKSQYVLKNGPVIGQLSSREPMRQGGFSGLIYLGMNGKNKEQTFVTISDRGPNGDLIKKQGSGDFRRPFVVPTYNPSLIFIETVSGDGTLKITREIPLTGPNGKALTGLAPAIKDANGNFEEPVTENEMPIAADLMGFDTESVAVDTLGNYWVGEEYRPAILSFSQNGRLVRMYVPENYYSQNQLQEIRKKFGSSAFIRQILPKDYRWRRVNRGFEGIVVKGNTVIASLQSALDKKGEDQKFARWLTLNSKTEAIKEYLYPLNDSKESRIGDLAVAANGNIFVIEQTSKIGPDAVHSIYEVKVPENTLAQAMAGAPNILTKTLALDMVATGVSEFEKVEGLAIIPFNQFAVVNDNDFGLTFNGRLGVDENLLPVLTIFTSPSAQLTSDETEPDSAQP